MTATPHVVLCTVPDAETGAGIARRVVEEKLAACVNMLPGVRSFYAWEGAIHDDAELLLVIKTVGTRLSSLRERLVALHPYDVPEVVVLDISGGSDAYLRWLGEQTTG